MNIESRVRDYIRANFLYGSPDKLGANDSLLDAGVIDSTGAMELVTFIETEFAVEVSDSDLTPENLDSIGAISAFIERKLVAKGSVSAD